MAAIFAIITVWVLKRRAGNSSLMTLVTYLLVDACAWAETVIATIPETYVKTDFSDTSRLMKQLRFL